MSVTSHGDGFEVHVHADADEADDLRSGAADSAPAPEPREGGCSSATIWVRINPTDSDEYVIYADADDGPQPWLVQTVCGRYHGWEYPGRVVGWPEFELPIPPTADPPDPERHGSP